MKKILLILISIFTVAASYAQQCTPDPQYTINDIGIYPDSVTNLAIGYVGQAYSDIITAVTPADTTVDGTAITGFPLGMIDVDIDSITILDVQGLPVNFTYSCNPPSCGFPGGTIACAELYSTSNPTAIGLYPIAVTTRTYVSGVPVLGFWEQDDVVDYYYIDIQAATNISQINKINSNTFELKNAYPNPVHGTTKIQFVIGKQQDLIFKLYDVIGNEIKTLNIQSTRGVNTITLNTEGVAEGVYMYSINNGDLLLTKRLLVTN